jgi:hypothetical protein
MEHPSRGKIWFRWAPIGPPDLRGQARQDFTLRIKLSKAIPRVFAVTQVRYEMTAWIGKKTRTLVVEYAQEACEQKVIATLNAGVTKRQGVAEGLRVEELANPRGDFAQILRPNQFAR